VETIETLRRSLEHADFEDGYREAHRSAFLLARHLGCSTEDAQDAVQEAAMRAWRYRAARHGPFRPWFLKIVFRAAMRGRRRWVLWPAAWNASADVPLEVTSTWDTDLVAALGRLPARQRAALWLRYCDDLSTATVASVMGTSETAARQLLFRARTALREEMRRHGS
jgi:RNA polymerase sigma-70 factor, ECF subfamily